MKILADFKICMSVPLNAAIKKMLAWEKVSTKVIIPLLFTLFNSFVNYTKNICLLIN